MKAPSPPYPAVTSTILYESVQCPKGVTPGPLGDIWTSEPALLCVSSFVYLLKNGLGQRSQKPVPVLGVV